MADKARPFSKLGSYYKLTKPGIIRGNILTAIAGFCVGSTYGFRFIWFVELIVGLSLVIASACICNNILDRPLDRKMERTKNRPLLNGSVSLPAASVLALATVVTGSYLLSRINLFTLLLALSGHVLYVVVYGVGKRRTTWSTVIGSVSGAIPPVVGYGAAHGKLDSIAALLFLSLVFWQMPHFYSIALYRIKDYRSAGLPLLPIVKGEARTKRAIIAYVIGYFVVVSLLGLRLKNHYVVAALALSALWWLSKVKNSAKMPTELWAKLMFRTSLLVILVFCLTLSIFGLVASQR